jgi:hypothetical protein
MTLPLLNRSPLHPESFANAYVSDPLTSVLGVLFSYYVLEHWRV